MQCARRPFGTRPVLTGCRNGCVGAVGGVSMLLCRDVAKLFLRARACSETHTEKKIIIRLESTEMHTHIQGCLSPGCCQCFVLFCGDSSLRTANLYRTYIPAAINTRTQPPSLPLSLSVPHIQYNRSRNKARGFTKTQLHRRGLISFALHLPSKSPPAPLRR